MLFVCACFCQFILGVNEKALSFRKSNSDSVGARICCVLLIPLKMSRADGDEIDQPQKVKTSNVFDPF